MYIYIFIYTYVYTYISIIDLVISIYYSIYIYIYVVNINKYIYIPLGRLHHWISLEDLPAWIWRHQVPVHQNFRTCPILQ